MPVGLSPAVAPSIKSKSDCNIHSYPDVVNMEVPAKADRYGGLANERRLFRPDYSQSFPQD
jgi:hypothetical protein